MHEADDINRLSENYREYVAAVCDTARIEIVDGRRIEWPSRSQWDGALAFGASFLIDTYLQQHPRGRTFRPAPRFLLRNEPLTIRVPDVAYLAAHRIAQFGAGEIWNVPPDLVVEVVSDASRRSEVDERVEDFLSAGTEIAWILDACDKTCQVRHSRGEARVFRENEKVYSAPVLPRLNLRVYELFGD